MSEKYVPNSLFNFVTRLELEVLRNLRVNIRYSSERVDSWEINQVINHDSVTELVMKATRSNGGSIPTGEFNRRNMRILSVVEVVAPRACRNEENRPTVVCEWNE